MLLLTALAVPAMGLVSWSSPIAYDPMGVRLAIACLALSAVAGTYVHDGVRAYSRAILIVVGQLVFTWFVVLAHFHGLTHDDAVGLLPCAAIAAMSVVTWPELVGVTLYALVAMALCGAITPEPEAPPGAITALVTLLTLGLSIASVARASSERRLAHLAQELEQRVAQRTADLRESLEQVEAVARQRAEAERRALAASQAKSQFLANMSHELRTPLNAITGYTQLVREELPPEAADLDPDLGRVDDAAKHLLALIDDVLDLSRIEADQLHLTMDTVDLREVVDDAVPLVPEASTSDRALTIAVPSMAVRADRDRLRQVLVNLLSNATKFTPSGEVTLGAERRGDRVRLWVEDTGIGIAPDVLPHVFERFHQADGSYTRRHEGTGLGLAICRELVERMGGSIAVESTVGSGSTFTVQLPAA